MEWGLERLGMGHWHATTETSYLSTSQVSFMATCTVKFIVCNLYRAHSNIQSHASINLIFNSNQKLWGATVPNSPCAPTAFVGGEGPSLLYVEEGEGVTFSTAHRGSGVRFGETGMGHWHTTSETSYLRLARSILEPSFLLPGTFFHLSCPLSDKK